LKPGYQIAQSNHGVSQFLIDYPTLAKKWNNHYLISLAVKTEDKLKILLSKLYDMDIPVSYFCEPDLNGVLTSISFLETDKTKDLTNKLPLSLINY
jgi:hypothetical protein